jgi:hypothetical protein
MLPATPLRYRTSFAPETTVTSTRVVRSNPQFIHARRRSLLAHRTN